MEKKNSPAFSKAARRKPPQRTRVEITTTALSPDLMTMKIIMEQLQTRGISP